MDGQAMQILVDADACPRGAMDVLRRLQRQYNFRLVTVASFHHNIGGAPAGGRTGNQGACRATEPHVQHVTVGDGPDAADYAVLNRARAGDIVVTQDWGLAALVLAKGARCLSPTGRVYEPQRIDFLLDERHVKAKHRRGGGRTKGPRARTEDDDRRFEHTLRRMLEGQGAEAP